MSPLHHASAFLNSPQSGLPRDKAHPPKNRSPNVSEDDRRNYHLERACSEIDSSYRAKCNQAAKAHMRLAALHMERLSSLEAPQPESPVGAATLPRKGH